MIDSRCAGKMAANKDYLAIIVIAWAAGAGSISNAIRASDLIATTGRDVCILPPNTRLQL
jgi:hypothetical protein